MSILLHQGLWCGEIPAKLPHTITSGRLLLRAGLLLMVMIGAIAPTSALASGRIIEADGDVLVRRSADNEESEYEPAAIGTILYRGDLIRPARGASITVRCLVDNTNWPVPAGVPSGLEVGCPRTNRAFNVRGRGENDFLEFLNQRFIFATQVTDSTPTFRWNPVSGATRYVVQVNPYRPGMVPDPPILWEESIDAFGEPAMGIAIPYQGPALEPMTDYQLVVFADSGQEMQFVLALRFQRLDEDTANPIQAAVTETQAQDLSLDAEAIALTDIYQSVAQLNTLPPDDAGLVFNAIAALERAIANGSELPYIHRQLGDLYLQVGLLEDAEQRYQATLDYAQQVRYGGDRAAAYVGLANIAAVRGDRRNAEAWLQRARVSYAALGNTEQFQQVTDWISRIYL